MTLFTVRCPSKETWILFKTKILETAALGSGSEIGYGMYWMVPYSRAIKALDALAALNIKLEMCIYAKNAEVIPINGSK